MKYKPFLYISILLVSGSAILGLGLSKLLSKEHDCVGLLIGLGGGLILASLISFQEYNREEKRLKKDTKKNKDNNLPGNKDNLENDINSLIDKAVKEKFVKFEFEKEILEFIVKQRGYLLYSSGNVHFDDGRRPSGIKECYNEELKLLQAKYGESKMLEIKSILEALNVKLA